MKYVNFFDIKGLLALRSDTRGVTALEYGLIAAVVGTTIAVAFSTYGTRLATAFAAIVV